MYKCNAQLYEEHFTQVDPIVEKTLNILFQVQKKENVVLTQ